MLWCTSHRYQTLPLVNCQVVCLYTYKTCINPHPHPPTPHPSINLGSCSSINLTTASGPPCTCNPCGSANVLTFGFTSRASARTFELCSGVHIEAVNYTTYPLC